MGRTDWPGGIAFPVGAAGARNGGFERVGPVGTPPVGGSRGSQERGWGERSGRGLRQPPGRLEGGAPPGSLPSCHRHTLFPSPRPSDRPPVPRLLPLPRLAPGYLRTGAPSSGSDAIEGPAHPTASNGRSGPVGGGRLAARRYDTLCRSVVLRLRPATSQRRRKRLLEASAWFECRRDDDDDEDDRSDQKMVLN